MVQLGGFLSFILPLAQNPEKVMHDSVTKVQDLAKNVPGDDFIKVAKVANVLKNSNR